MSIDIKEDSQHPARFYLDMGGETLMEIAIVGTDYANWAVVWAKSGSAGACSVSFTSILRTIRVVILLIAITNFW